MAVTRALRRLLRVLTIEEEQVQAALEVALTDLRQLEKQWDASIERQRSGRRLIAASAHTGNVVDRCAGLEEVTAGGRAVVRLRPRILQAQDVAAQCRTKLMAKRVEQRQADTLIRAAESRLAVEVARRTQQSTDDWYLDRMRRVRFEDEVSHQSALEAPRKMAAKLE